MILFKKYLVIFIEIKSEIKLNNKNTISFKSNILKKLYLLKSKSMGMLLYNKLIHSKLINILKNNVATIFLKLNIPFLLNSYFPQKKEKNVSKKIAGHIKKYALEYSSLFNVSIVNFTMESNRYNIKEIPIIHAIIVSMLFDIKSIFILSNKNL